MQKKGVAKYTRKPFNFKCDIVTYNYVFLTIKSILHVKKTFWDHFFIVVMQLPKFFFPCFFFLLFHVRIFIIVSRWDFLIRKAQLLTQPVCHKLETVQRCKELFPNKIVAFSRSGAKKKKHISRGRE